MSYESVSKWLLDTVGYDNQRVMVCVQKNRKKCETPPCEVSPVTNLLYKRSMKICNGVRNKKAEVSPVTNLFS